MEPKDWWLLLAGTLLGFMASLLANYTSSPLANVATKFRSGIVERSRKRARRNYRKIKALKEDQAAIVAHFVVRATAVIVILLLLILTRLTGGVVIYDPDKFHALFIVENLFDLFAIFFMFGALIYLCWWLLIVSGRLEGFEVYERALNKRWPGFTEEAMRLS
jgi:hypothetical protein